MKDPEQITQSWLENISSALLANADHNHWRYTGNASLLLSEGKRWLPRPRPEFIPLGLSKQCFHNAWSVANEFEGAYTYCEGYMCSESLQLPVEHAWVVDKGGFAIDVTRIFPAEYYFGIAFKVSYVNRIYGETCQSGVLDNWKQKYPLLRGTDSLEAAVASIHKTHCSLTTS